jgi:hypothetical protein
MYRHRVAAGMEHVQVLSGLDCRTVVDIGVNRGNLPLLQGGAYRRHGSSPFSSRA